MAKSFLGSIIVCALVIVLCPILAADIAGDIALEGPTIFTSGAGETK